MIDDRERAVLQSPVRNLLRRTASWGTLPDEHELASLDIDDDSRERLRECVDIVAQIAAQGGMRARHAAGEHADRLAAALLAEVPRGYAGRVAPATPDLPDVIKVGGDHHEVVAVDQDTTVDSESDLRRLALTLRPR